METGRLSGEQDEEKRQEVRRKMEKDDRHRSCFCDYDACDFYCIYH